MWIHTTENVKTFECQMEWIKIFSGIILWNNCGFIKINLTICLTLNSYRTYIRSPMAKFRFANGNCFCYFWHETSNCVQYKIAINVAYIHPLYGLRNAGNDQLEQYVCVNVCCWQYLWEWRHFYATIKQLITRAYCVYQALPRKLIEMKICRRMCALRTLSGFCSH